MKLTGAAVQAFLKNPDPQIRVVLVYGPDEGLVRERLDQLLRTVVDDPGDPFRVCELGGDDLVRDPARLADEAAALSMVGGRRVVRLRDVGDSHTARLKPFFEHPVGEALILVQGGALGPRSSLRLLVEGSPMAAALPCYADEGRGLETLVRDMLAGAKLAAGPDVVEFLSDHLGGDRALTRSEIDKLITYCGAAGRVSLEDAQACVGDTARLELDDLAHAIAEGDAARALRTLERLRREGTNAVAIVRSVMRHFTRLHFVAGQVAEGRSLDQVMPTLKPPVIFSQAARFRTQASRWPAVRLAQALDLLLETEGALKSAGVLETPVMERLVLRLTRGAQTSARSG
ncbi:DNA polymerase III subunit delta [Pararhodospirillum photometricum]|uniref:DNA-directed DNA polymerase n=1 Tax=Pararhodospirillum photometricum DSM 122 TaxID=1150469 RepID=H6SN32_PARPM|nr:DNA polymerase III subunit delta [Pararhodospirillum photometricum]CCG06908.1 DNA polymerase III, delta subunit [Pararhodospirillum photometricum DSM 122]